MTYDEAKAIAAEHAPALIIDPPFSDLPMLFAVRKTAKGAPFSIHLPSALDQADKTAEEITDEERPQFIDALNAAVKALG